MSKLRMRLSTRFELSSRTTTLLSIVLGCVFYALGSYVTRGTYTVGHTIFGVQIQLLSPYVALTLLFIGAIAPWIAKAYGHLDLRLRPRPGAYALAADSLVSLEKSLVLDRYLIEESMVPSHSPSARTASTSLAVDLGDAALVIPPSEQVLIRNVIGRPRNPKLRATSPRDECEREVLMITGEPGGGKSVILQEIHSSLSTGVGEGLHSFVPLIVLARDISLASLEGTGTAAEYSLQEFLAAHYEYRRIHTHNGADLAAIESLIRHEWDRLDFIVLVDGLDEIAQRSVYERIQQALARLILRDIRSGRAAVHRFVLSCRTDEDLELFRDANKVFLRGLTTERERQRFCQAVIANASASPASRRSIELALTSRRLVPAHVFHRNPYFLALLVRHLRDDQDRVKEDTLDFDFLMRKYLEREAQRPYASLDRDSAARGESRRALFNELEMVARLCLQFLAYRSAWSQNTTDLYREIAIDRDVLSAFLRELDRAPRDLQEYTCWTALPAFLAQLTGHSGSVDDATARRTVMSGVLHENDVRILGELAEKTRATTLTVELIFASFGLIPFRRLLEEESWYRALAARLHEACSGLGQTARDRLALLLFIRSLAAAHVLRIMWIKTDSSVTVRFRHRRLAEYFAACFLKDRWRDLDPPAFRPWLSPIMNLTCAIEGTRCWALRWLVDRVPRVLGERRYEWRHDFEAAIEASFFAQPGASYASCIRDLLSLAVSTLHDTGLHSTLPSAGTRLDVVTELTVIRSIDNLSRLSHVTGQVSLHGDLLQKFRRYEQVQPAEWVGEFAIASRGVSTLTGQAVPITSRMKTVWRLIQQPGAVLSSSRWRHSDLTYTFTAVFVAVVVGEALLFAAFAGLIVAGLRLLAGGNVSQSELRSAQVVLPVVALVPWLVLRAQAWRRSRTRAAFWSSCVWRLLPALRQLFVDVASPGIFGLRIVRVALESFWRQGPTVAVGVVLLAGIGLFVLQRTDVVWLEDDFPEGQLPTAVFEAGSAPEPNVKPCVNVNTVFQRIFRTFTAPPNNVPVRELQQLRQRLTSDLAELRSVNQTVDCGFQSDEAWLLAEDRAADILFERDERLVPLPDHDARRAISEKDAWRLAELSRAQLPPVPPSGVVGSILLFRVRQEVAEQLTELKALRQRAIDSRRDGAVEQLVLVARQVRPGNGSVRSFIEASDQQLKALTDAQTILENRGKASLIWLVVGAVPAVLLMSVVMYQISKQLNNRRLTAVLRTSSVAGLAQHLEKQSHSEWVRREIIRAISSREMVSADDVSSIERAAGRLYGRHSVEDRLLAVEAADLVVALSKRLRHRLIDDSPIASSRDFAGKGGDGIWKRQQ